MRLFVALSLPEELRKRLAALVEGLARTRAPVKWVKRNNMHLTLKFLGEVEESRLQEIYEVCRLSAKEVRPFSIRVGEIGAFPSTRRPRVIWVGANQPAELMTLHRRIEEGFQSTGFPAEKRRWTPHLTVGRVKGTQNMKALTSELERASLDPFSFRVESFHVIQSVLKPEGPVYSVLKSIMMEIPDRK